MRCAPRQSGALTDGRFGVGSRLTLVFLCDGLAIDVDNVIKPIQDALIGVAYADDNVLTDVESHRRMMGEPMLFSALPPLLRKPWIQGPECIYIRLDHPYSDEAR